MALLQPLEFLDADDVGAENLHGLDHLLVQELPDGLGALLSGLLGSLHGDELVTLLGDDGGDLAT